jgi:hypothetical protein
MSWLLTKRKRLGGFVSAIALRATSNGGLSGLGLKGIMKLPHARSTPSWPTCSLLALPRPSLEAKPPIPRDRDCEAQRESWEEYTRLACPSLAPHRIKSGVGKVMTLNGLPIRLCPGQERVLSEIGTRGRPPPGTILTLGFPPVNFFLTRGLPSTLPMVVSTGPHWGY